MLESVRHLPTEKLCLLFPLFEVKSMSSSFLGKVPTAKGLRKINIGFKIKMLTRPEEGGCIVIRRPPITQSQTFIVKPIAGEE
jgi:hypothetical protein